MKSNCYLYRHIDHNVSYLLYMIIHDLSIHIVP